MTWLERVKLAYRAITLSDFPQLAPFLMEGTSVAPGITVNEQTALTNSAFWNGINIISSQIATLPRAVYRRVADDERERDRESPAAKVMIRPNENMTDVVFWETVMAHALTWGNAYAEIELDNAGRPLALWPITPDRVSPVLEGRRLRYRVTGVTNGMLDPDEILHFPGLGFDGLRGYSVIAMARHSLSLGMAAERFGAGFFGNGARPSVVLQHPGKLSPEAQIRLRTSWTREQGGANQLGVAVAEEGMTVETIGIPPEDAQFLQTREFQIDEIGRWLNINPVKLKSKGGERPGGNLETSQLEFLTDTLRPWLVRIEQELNRKLFAEGERERFYVEHNVEAMLRVDNASRMAGYKALVDLGVMTPEQIARKENLPAPEDRQAPLTARIESVAQLIRAGFDPDESARALGLPIIRHLGVLPVTVQMEQQPKEPSEGPGEDKPSEEDKPSDAPAFPGAFTKDSQRMAAALRSVLVDQVARFVRRESWQAKRAAKKGPVEFSAWLDEFYGNEGSVLRELIQTGVNLQMAFAGVEGDAAGASERLAAGYLQRSRDQLESLKTTNLERDVDEVMERWQTWRPVEMVEAIEVEAMKENINAA